MTVSHLDPRSDWIARLSSAIGQRFTQTALPNTLLVRPACQENESRAAHLLRVAMANHLGGIESLGKLFGKTPSKLLFLTETALAQLFRGIPPDQLTEPTLRIGSETEMIRRRLWPRSRICPECIRQGSVIPRYFDFPLTVRCETHDLWLLEICPTCCDRFTYFRKQTGLCNCGQRLDRLQSAVIDPGIDVLNLVFAPWRVSDLWRSDPGPFLSEEIASAAALNSIINELQTTPNDPSRVVPWLHTADWPVVVRLLAKFPSGLNSVIQDLCIDMNERDRGAFLARIDRAGLPLLSEVTNAARKASRDRRSSRVISIPVKGNLEVVSKAHIREIAKLDAASIEVLFDNEFSEADHVLPAAPGGRHWVSARAARELKKWFAETVDLDEASRILGCPDDFVSGLVRFKLLDAEFLSPKTRSPRFRRTTLDGHLLALASLKKQPSPTADLVPVCALEPAPINKKRWRKGWQSLINDVLSGQLDAFSQGSGVGWQGIGLFRADVTRVLGRHWEQIYVSLPTTSVS